VSNAEGLAPSTFKRSPAPRLPHRRKHVP